MENHALSNIPIDAKKSQKNPRTEIFYQHTKCFSPQLGVGGMIYWLFGKPIHAPVKEKIDCQQNSEFAWEGCLAQSIL